MGNGNVGLRFNVDVSQAKGQVGDLSKVVADLNEELKKATEEKDWKSVAMFSQAIENTTSSRQRVMQQANQAQSETARQNMKSGLFGGQEAWILQQSLHQITSGIISSMDAALSAAKQRASGDYAGAAITEKRASGEIAGQGIGAGTGAVVGSVLTAFTGQAWLIPLLSGLAGEIGKFIGGIDAKKMEEDLAYSQQYKNALPSIDLLNQYFGGAINRKTPEENNQQGLQMYGRAGTAANGTGLSTQEFIEAMKQVGAAGVKDETQALNMTRTQALWARFTGADLSAIQKFGGQTYRYGGETGAVATAYGGLMAQGMAKGQFGEFLNAMERILEEGIAKGFVRSSEEIAGNMQMLYKLSGDSALWQGEQGAQRLSQMNTAVANATNLQSVADVISFGAARDILGGMSEDKRRELLEGPDGKKGGVYTGGTYVDAMQLLERGISADLLKGQFEAVSSLGDDKAGIIEWFKQMYGLNYTGGAQVWAMMENGKDPVTGEFTFDAAEYEKAIKALREDPKNLSDSEKLQNTLNNLDNTLVNIGQVKFDLTEYPTLTQQAQNVADILTELRAKKEMVIPDIPEQSMSEVAGGKQVLGQAITNTILNYTGIPKDSSGMDEYKEVQKRYSEIINGIDPRVIGMSANAMLLSEYLPKAIADGAFTVEGNRSDYAEANRIIERMATEIQSLVNILQSKENMDRRDMRVDLTVIE